MVINSNVRNAYIHSLVAASFSLRNIVGNRYIRSAIVGAIRELPYIGNFLQNDYKPFRNNRINSNVGNAYMRSFIPAGIIPYTVGTNPCVCPTVRNDYQSFRIMHVPRQLNINALFTEININYLKEH